MDSEIEKIIAFIFKRSGKEELTFSDFYLTLSMDLKWFTPEEAKQIINNALNENILTKNEDLIRPTFDINSTSIPLGFYPSKKTKRKEIDNKKKEEKNTIQSLIKKIAKKQGVEETDTINIIKKLESEKNILFEVAVLLVAKDFGINVDEYIKELEENSMIL